MGMVQEFHSLPQSLLHRTFSIIIMKKHFHKQASTEGEHTLLLCAFLIIIIKAKTFYQIQIHTLCKRLKQTSALRQLALVTLTSTQVRLESKVAKCS